MVKRLLSALSVILLCVLVNAQVTTEPAFIQKGYKGKIIVNFDPTLGNAGMVGATECYAHTGLITSNSKDGGDWKYATKTWRGGEDKYKMTKNGNVWQLTIPNIYEYYGCPESEEILKLAFVFNDGPNGTKEGKTDDGLHVSSAGGTGLIPDQGTRIPHTVQPKKKLYQVQKIQGSKICCPP